ncbi:DUF3466 family protein [Vibrio sp. HN007]|uniref:DUF3466 family protein n=1 Tax=Vibrio iocasae TaxID=3098914 RepID=UPI0035D44E9D
MSSKTFKLSTVATFVLAATNANAALYQVVEISPSSSTVEYHASAIEAESGSTNCFSTNCGTGTAYSLAGDTLVGEGFSFKNEVPYRVDNHFNYQDLDDLESYCNSQLKYSTCEAWAERNWLGNSSLDTGGLQNEREAFYQSSYKSNHSSFFDSTNYTFTPSAGSAAPGSLGSVHSNTIDTVVNSMYGTTGVIGNTSSGYYESNYSQIYRQRGFYATSASSAVVLEPAYESAFSINSGSKGAEERTVNQMGRTFAYDSFEHGGKTYIVGSASVATFDYNDSNKDYGSRDVGTCITTAAAGSNTGDPALSANCQNFGFATKAYIWDTTDSGVTKHPVSPWGMSGTQYANYDEAASQASVRAAVIADRTGSTYNTTPVLVGFNTERDGNNMMMQAAVFRPTTPSSFSVADNAWTSTFIANATVKIGSDFTYSNSLAKAINKNLIVVGESKLRGDTPENGAAASKMFVADANASTPTATYFNGTESIFFSGAGGEVNAINNFNEIVGAVDAETHREVNGKIRKRRGYIYPYNNSAGTDSSRREIFSNRAWWLDDLTNGGSYSSSNNKYRIISASDINDAGVISATALRCASGYDSTAHFSYCGNGKETETIVAVKLVPIAGAKSTDISARATEEDTKVSRSGGGVGWLSIALLSLLGFRRRK